MDAWFGVDVGGTQVKTAMVSSDGAILCRFAFDTLPERGAQDVAIRIGQALPECAKAAGVALAQVRGVGVGVPGFIDARTGFIHESANTGWAQVPFGQLLERELSLPVVVENDANVAALGEAWVGAGAGAEVVLCTTVGTGVGAGVVVFGRALSGANGMAGEIGHMIIDREHPLPCGCGRRGCMETRASATAIVRAARERQEAGELPTSVDIRGAVDVFLLAQTGYAAAQAVVADAAGWLGYGLALCATVLNPGVIVIGGGVSKAGSSYLEAVRRSFEVYALRRTVDATVLRLAALGNDAGTVGAARLAAVGAGV